jgi:hypothetical protein
MPVYEGFHEQEILFLNLMATNIRAGDYDVL